MIRIAKLTDYGIVLLTHIARDRGSGVHTAREVASAAKLPFPTVSQLLKSLSRSGLLVSHLGVKGGYTLARKPDEISVLDVIDALEGRVAVTECNEHPAGNCNLETVCPVRANWQRINIAVRRALQNLRMSDMIRPLPEDYGPAAQQASRVSAARPS